mgnify:CR=1 FL=1
MVSATPGKYELEKAKNDIDAILVDEGYKPLPYEGDSSEPHDVISKIAGHYRRYRGWIKTIKNIQENDTVILQYPLRNHTVFFAGIMRKLKRKNVH